MDVTAMKLLIPMNKEDLPVVMAIKGREGMTKGRDYRGKEVIAPVSYIHKLDKNNLLLSMQ